MKVFLLLAANASQEKQMLKLLVRITIGAIIIIKDLVYNPLGKIFFSVLKIGILIFIINLA